MSERLAERGHAHWGSIRKSAQEILNVRREIRARETPAAAFVERRGLASAGFFLTLLASHLLWLLLNLPVYPWPPRILMDTLREDLERDEGEDAATAP